MQQSTNGVNEEVGKGRKFRIVTPELSETIVSVRRFFEKEKLQQQHIHVRRPVARTAECLGILARTVTRVTKKVDTGKAFPVQDDRSREMTVSEKFIPIVRNVIHKMYQAKEHVTLDTIYEKLKSKGGKTRKSKWT